MDDVSYKTTTITIDGEVCEVDAVKDPRIGRPEPWQARGNYRAEFLYVNGETYDAAFKNWEKKARELS